MLDRKQKMFMEEIRKMSEAHKAGDIDVIISVIS